MARKAIQFACMTSLVLFGVSVVLVALSLSLNPWDHRVSLTDEFHIGLWRGRVVFFNDAEYGPYRGSIISLVPADGNLHPPLEREITWGSRFWRLFSLLPMDGFDTLDADGFATVAARAIRFAISFLGLVSLPASHRPEPCWSLILTWHV